jgi:hypothetical protein
MAARLISAISIPAMQIGVLSTTGMVFSIIWIPVCHYQS